MTASNENGNQEREFVLPAKSEEKAIQMFNEMVDFINANTVEDNVQDNGKRSTKNPKQPTAKRKRAKTKDNGYKDKENLIEYWKQADEKGLAQRAYLLLADGFQCPKKAVRSATFPDIRFLKKANHEDHDVFGGHVMNIAWNYPKTKRGFGPAESFLMRHRVVSLCPMGALAFHFFQRFHVNMEEWPSFSKRGDYYPIPVFDDEMIEFNPAEIPAYPDETNRLMCGPFFMNWFLIRKIAGLQEDGKVIISRALLEPPRELQLQIFPGLEGAQAEIKDALDSGVYETEGAGTAFLQLLECFRTVLLQDACVLQEDPLYKDHPILQHECFSSPAFLAYKKMLLQLAKFKEAERKYGHL